MKLYKFCVDNFSVICKIKVFKGTNFLPFLYNKQQSDNFTNHSNPPPPRKHIFQHLNSYYDSYRRKNMFFWKMASKTLVPEHHGSYLTFSDSPVRTSHDSVVWQISTKIFTGFQSGDSSVDDKSICCSKMAKTIGC